MVWQTLFSKQQAPHGSIHSPHGSGSHVSPAIQWAPPAVDVTSDIVTALNTRKPTVTTAVPAGWQPSREILQLQQTVQQILVAAAQQQAAQVQQAQPRPATQQQPPAQPTGR